MHLPILQLLCRRFWQNIASPMSVSTPYSQDLFPCDFWLFPKLNSPLKERRFVNATVTQYTSSVNGVSLPTDYPHGRVTVHGCTVRSPLTVYHVMSVSLDRFLRYSKLLDTFRTALVRAHIHPYSHTLTNMRLFCTLGMTRRVRQFFIQLWTH
jgi:hypothetical protein